MSNQGLSQVFKIWVFERKKKKNACLPLTKSLALSSNHRGKKSFFKKRLTIISGYWFALKNERGAKRVGDINTLRREECSECGHKAACLRSGMVIQGAEVLAFVRWNSVTQWFTRGETGVQTVI